MNPVANLGQPGQAPNAQQAAQMQQRMANIPMYRPEQMRSITLLTEQEKIKYERGLASLWRMHDSAPQGSPESNEAKKKIMDFGKMLAMKMHERKNQAIQNRQAPQLQQPPQLNQPPGAGVVGQNLGGAGTDTSGLPSSSGLPASTGPAAVGGVGNPAAQNAPSGAAKPAAPQGRLPPHIAEHLNQITFQPPPNVQEQDKTRWINDLKLRYTKALLTMESTRQNVTRLDQTLKERQEKGNPLSPEEQKSVVEKKGLWQKQYGEAQNFLNQARKQYVVAQPRPQQQNGAPQAGGPGENAVSNVGGSAGGSTGQNNSMQSSTATVNAAIEAAKNQQLAAIRVPGANGLPGQQPALQAQQQQMPASLAQAQPSPALAPPSQIPTAQQQQLQQTLPAQTTSVKMEPGTQPVQPPAPLNTAVASTVAAGLPSAGTPTQASARVQTPQSATPTGAPRPLSHTAALHLANQRSASLPGTQGGPPTSGSQPQTTPGVIATTQQGHPHVHPQTATTQLPSKLPIPKVLPEKATQIPTPAANMGGLGTGRPSYSGGSGTPGGVMGQPVLAKTPAYQLEGDGERVLNKKKLDELVRQVCGGTAEGQEGNLLTPEVEEVGFFFRCHVKASCNTHPPGTTVY